MPATGIKILLIEDNPGDARLIREMLAEAEAGSFTLEWVSTLSEGLQRLDEGQMDLVLLDLGLPDSRGLETFAKAQAHAPEIPFVLLTGLDDATLALTAMRQGAQDYLVKGSTDGNTLLRAMRYATERKAAAKALEIERRKLYSVLNSLPAFVHLTGTDFTIRFVNQRFREIFGEPGDRPCYEVLLGKNQPCQQCGASEVLKTMTPKNVEWTSPRNGRVYEVSQHPFCTGHTPLALTLGLDITDRKQAEAQLRESEKNLRHLASQLLTAQESERERISRELHDELGQSLLVLKLQASRLAKKVEKDQPAIRKECRDITRHLDRLVDETRRLARDLSPAMVRDLGLSSALRRLIEEFCRHNDIQADIDQMEDIDGLFSRETQINIYRTFQESLTNIGKYAQASRLTVAIQPEDSRVAFMLADNGRGFNVGEVLGDDPTRRGLGLMAMKERAHMMGGVLEINSEVGQGTRITFTIPVSLGRA
jgi:two-component system sensor histidine kinase UhpB